MSTRITGGVSTESPVVIVPTLVLYSSGDWYYGPFRTRFTEVTKYGVACLIFSVWGENLYFYQQGSPTDQDIKNMLSIAEKTVGGRPNVGHNSRFAEIC